MLSLVLGSIPKLMNQGWVRMLIPEANQLIIKTMASKDATQGYSPQDTSVCYFYPALEAIS